MRESVAKSTEAVASLRETTRRRRRVRKSKGVTRSQNGVNALEDDDLGVLDEGARQRDKTPLADRQVLTLVFDDQIKREASAVRGGGHRWRSCRRSGSATSARRRLVLVDQPSSLERVVQLGILVLAKRIEVGPNRAGKQEGVLRQDGNLFAQVGETDLGNVNPVDFDRPGRDLDDAEEGLHDRRLAGSSPTDHLRAQNKQPASIPAIAPRKPIKPGHVHRSFLPRARSS